MSDENTKTVVATFQTREAADLAVQHMVQKAGLDRAAIFLEAVGRSNSAGKIQSGGDTASANHETRMDAPLRGEIAVSVDARSDQAAVLHRIFGDAGAIHAAAR